MSSFKVIFDKDTWQEIFGSISKNKTRTIITVIGVLWGIFIYITLSGAAKGLDNGFERQFENIAAYRFVNTNDIVCTVPPFGLYTHVGELHYMSYKGIILTKTSWWQRMGDKFRGRLRAWQKRQLFSGIYDHMGSRYIKKIKQQ